MYKTNNQKTQKTRRFKKSVRLNAVLMPELKPVFNKRGIRHMGLIHDWDKIVGDHIAEKTLVDKITHTGKKRVLHIKSLGAYATELSCQSAYVLQKVNAYLGFRAVDVLKIHHSLPVEYIRQKQLQTTQQAQHNRPPPRMDIAVIESIEDENIKNSLRRMAGSVYNDT